VSPPNLSPVSRRRRLAPPVPLRAIERPIRPHVDRPRAFARLWESWRGPESDERIDPATIIVGAANDWMRCFHDRMPVILDWRDAGAWMTGDDPNALLRAPPDDALQEWIVSTRVNR
jgi:putative SOS response-associated peptidase YedK